MTDQTLSLRLDQLLSESLDSARARQANTLDSLIGSLEQPFALFGASHLGRKALQVLKQLGHVPGAFIDNNSAAWGSEIDGVPVMSPAQLAEREQGLLPAIICTIWSGHIKDRMSQRLQPLRELGFERIALFGHLAWCYPQHFLPHYALDLPEKVLQQADAVRRAFSLIEDAVSQQLFVDHVQWRLDLNHDLLPPASSKEIYFDAHFSSASADEVVYDIGAYNGDSVADYLRLCRAFKEIHSFEPSPANYAELQANLARLSSEHSAALFAHPLAVGDSVGSVLIEDDGGASNRVGHGTQQAQSSTLDELSKQIAPATFLKIDIEGFEPQCLAGGRQLIATHRPVIAVCVYHEQDHLWRILLQLHEYYPGYRFELCPHLAEGWDLVLYAVPAERLPTHLQQGV